MNYFDAIIANKLFGGGDSPVPPVPPAPSGGDELYDVMFYDYDGTVLNHYTKDEFLALSTMPENPTREGLTAQGWNWTLADAKEYVRDHRIIDIGQLYTTDDGATRLHISMNEATGKVFTLIFYCSVADSITVDWGDGSPTVTPSSGAYTNHEYADYGNYIISLTPSGDTQFGNYSTNPFASGDVSKSMITEINLGNNIVADRMYLANLSCVRKISMPNIPYSSSATIPSISHNYVLQHMTYSPSFGVDASGQPFSGAYHIKHLCLPKGAKINSVIPSGVLVRMCLPDNITTLSSSFFSGCNCLRQVAMPTSLQTIQNSAFSNSVSLEEITLPSTVTSIASYAFNCYSLTKMYVLAETPPSLANSNVFGAVPKSCLIYVPESSLETYKSATNWSVFASQMVGM